MIPHLIFHVSYGYQIFAEHASVVMLYLNKVNYMVIETETDI
jgi:hypothetical protein